MLLALLFACTAATPGSHTRRGSVGGGDGGLPEDGGLDQGDGGSEDTGDTGEPGPDFSDRDRVVCDATASRGRCTLRFPTAEESPVFRPGISFDAVVPSWNAETPAGSWIEVALQAQVDGSWTEWAALGVWAVGESAVDRHSVSGQSFDFGRVATDTLLLTEPAEAVRLRIIAVAGSGGMPTVSRMSVAMSDQSAQDADEGGLAWGSALDVPERSQMAFAAGQAWCSPTSTSMQVGAAAWRLGDDRIDADVPTTADQVWDSVYGGTGNWPFNTAFAATRGLEAEVGWLGSVSQIEPWIAAGWPVAISVAWDQGELDNAPISASSGHLLLVRGFSASGDLLVHDPAAATDSGVPRSYDREQLRAAWMGGSGGVAYLIWSGDRPVGEPAE